jgi:hypothetical protein
MNISVLLHSDMTYVSGTLRPELRVQLMQIGLLDWGPSSAFGTEQ